MQEVVMENTNAFPQYEPYFALSIRGASHFKSGKPMQDYSKAARCDDHCIGIVCDGHGSDKHFRSEVGSRLATEVTFDLLSAWAQTYPTWDDFNHDLPARLDRLKLAILTNWQRAVEAYSAENPFTEDELAKASGTFKNRRTFDLGNPYGTTLLATLMCRDYYLVVMLGDGAIMKIKPGTGDNPAMTATGEMVKFEGKNAFDDAPHGATDSLCGVDSYQNIFFSYDKIDETEDEGLLFALGSDGISEAFARDESLVREFMIHFGNFVQVGLEQALQDSETRLNLLSQKSANQDDISIAYVTFDQDAYACILEEEVEEETEDETEDTEGEEAPVEDAEVDEAQDSTAEEAEFASEADWDDAETVIMPDSTSDDAATGVADDADI